MSESAWVGTTVRFGVFEVDLKKGELRKDGIKIKLQQQPFQILVTLLERPGEVVTRQDLRLKLWPVDTHVDFYSSLKTAVNKIREALGDSAENPRFIETLNRRGYRFIAPVSGMTPAIPPERSLTGRITVAVLPFNELSAVPERQDFSDGLTEEMITQLSRVRPEQLEVIACTSAMHYKASNKGIDQIGRELNVKFILQGGVRRAGGRLRISAQLVDVQDQTNLWAESYERSVTDVFAIQYDVARRIAQSLKFELLPSTREMLTTRATANPTAYEAYLKGLYFWVKATPDALARGKEYTEQAIGLFPSSADTP